MPPALPPTYPHINTPLFGCRMVSAPRQLERGAAIAALYRHGSGKELSLARTKFVELGGSLLLNNPQGD